MEEYRALLMQVYQTPMVYGSAFELAQTLERQTGCVHQIKAAGFTTCTDENECLYYVQPMMLTKMVKVEVKIAVPVRKGDLPF